MRYKVDEANSGTNVCFRDGVVQLVCQPAGSPGMDEIVRNRVRDRSESADQCWQILARFPRADRKHEGMAQLVSLAEGDDLLTRGTSKACIHPERGDIDAVRIDMQ